MKILARIAIFGPLAAIEQLEATRALPLGMRQQVGLRHRPPLEDSWLYGTTWFRFRPDSLDEEVLDFLQAHASLGQALSAVRSQLEWAMLTLSPVGESDEETFACLLGVETLQALADLGLALEIAPAQVMPDVPFWSLAHPHETPCLNPSR